MVDLILVTPLISSQKISHTDKSEILEIIKEKTGRKGENKKQEEKERTKNKKKKSQIISIKEGLHTDNASLYMKSL